MTAELIEILGMDKFLDLAEAHGGTRLTVPFRMADDHPIVAALGLEAAHALKERFAPDCIRVPLAREMRAIRYRNQGLSIAKIASRLVMTETGVNKIIRRYSGMLNP